MHAKLVEKFLALQKAPSSSHPILDLACGSGRNGLHCVDQGYPVIFADKNNDSLTGIKTQLGKNEAEFWPVDFEQNDEKTLPVNRYQAVMVFRYLHRPLFNQIKSAIIPGGYIVYETFTTDNRQFGRPKNVNFLLALGELKTTFSDWQILYEFEGHCLSETSGREQAIAQIIAKKPDE